jgi:hypothetical protein
MSFAAYQARHDGTDFSREGRDEAAGILGVFKPNDDKPVATADTLEHLEQAARAYLGKEPDAFLYLTDGDCRVLRMMMLENHHAAIDRANRRTAMAAALLIFCMTCLIGASLGSFGGWALLCFLGASALYVFILWWGLFNEVEAALMCEIMLILALLSPPALQKLTDRQNRSPRGSVGLVRLEEQFRRLTAEQE